jgi:hypothetical protein
VILCLCVPKVIPRAAGRQICWYISGASLPDGPHDDGVSDEEVVVGVLKSFGIVQVVVPQRPQNRQTKHCPLSKNGVPSWQHLVADSDLLSHIRSYLVTQQPWLPSLCLKVRVATVEGIPDTKLVPPPEKLWFWIEKESWHVSTTEGHAAHAQSQEHGHRPLQEVPPCHVVASPHRRVSMRASVKRPCQQFKAIHSNSGEAIVAEFVFLKVIQ